MDNLLPYLLIRHGPPNCPDVTSFHGTSNAHINLISSVHGSWIAAQNTWYNLLRSKHPPGWLQTLKHLEEGTDCQRKPHKGRWAAERLPQHHLPWSTPHRGGRPSLTILASLASGYLFASTWAASPTRINSIQSQSTPPP